MRLGRLRPSTKVEGSWGRSNPSACRVQALLSSLETLALLALLVRIDCAPHHHPYHSWPHLSTIERRYTKLLFCTHTLPPSLTRYNLIFPLFVFLLFTLDSDLGVVCLFLPQSWQPLLLLLLGTESPLWALPSRSCKVLLVLASRVPSTSVLLPVWHQARSRASKLPSQSHKERHGRNTLPPASRPRMSSRRKWSSTLRLLLHDLSSTVMNRKSWIKFLQDTRLTVQGRLCRYLTGLPRPIDHRLEQDTTTPNLCRPKENIL